MIDRSWLIICCRYVSQYILVLILQQHDCWFWVLLIKMCNQFIIYKTNRQYMLQNLRNYANKLNRMQQNERQIFEKMKQSYIDQFRKQLEESSGRHWDRYQINKNKLSKDLETVQYYLKMGEISIKPEEEKEQLEIKENERKLFAQTLKNVNLYSLFKSIDDKLLFNHALLNDFKFTCALPINSQNQLENLISLSKIQSEQIYEYSNLISTLLTKLNRPSKEYHLAYLAIQQKYTNLLKKSQKQQKYQIKVKDSLNYVVSSLVASNYLRSVDLSIVNDQGIISCEQYDRLGSALLTHRFYLKSVNIKLMDMQFCQQKCDTLKRYLKKMKVLDKLLIKNYYSECKLGQFVDFRWHPYRKIVNISAGTWK